MLFCETSNKLQQYSKLWHFVADENIQTITNHPVHIIDENYNLSPSSFIPYCDIGGNMSMMSTKIENFDIPVCNSFKTTFLMNQLCYEVDINKFRVRNNDEKNLKIGIGLLLDFNEDRQVQLFSKKNYKSFEGLSNYIIKNEAMDKAIINLGTIGNQ